MKTSRRYLYLLCLPLLMAGCSTTTVRTTQHQAALKATTAIPENQLLDVGINIFDPGVDENSPEQEGVYPPIRRAEARYIPYHLMQTLQRTGNWGVVRVIPDKRSQMNLWIDGKILKSNGAELQLKIKATDASNRVWLDKTYTEKASKYAYDSSLKNSGDDPFQGLYNQIANDLLKFRQDSLQADDIKTIRTITELKFARDFAPEAFNEYITRDGSGRYRIKRLPAENDPLLARIHKIRERDYMFVDTLQDYYGSFSRQMQPPYQDWRKQSYDEIIKLDELNKQSTVRTLGGIVAIAASVAAIITGCGANSSYGRSACQLAGTAGVIGGGYMVKSGIDKHAEAKLHAQSLEELSRSLNAEIQPHTIQLQDRTVTLTGTVDQQYNQWRQILQKMYSNETGQPPPAEAAK
jgi:hypothetical protein